MTLEWFVRHGGPRLLVLRAWVGFSVHVAGLIIMGEAVNEGLLDRVHRAVSETEDNPTAQDLVEYLGLPLKTVEEALSVLKNQNKVDTFKDGAFFNLIPSPRLLKFIKEETISSEELWRRLGRE